jgi:hypothetical protein
VNDPATASSCEVATSPLVSTLFAKLLACVLAIIVTGATLLTIRHQRLEAMHRIAEARAAIDREEATRRTLEARLASLVDPDRLRARLRTVDIGPWVPRPERGRDGAADETLAEPPPVTPAPPRFRPDLVRHD